MTKVINVVTFDTFMNEKFSFLQIELDTKYNQILYIWYKKNLNMSFTDQNTQICRQFVDRPWWVMMAFQRRDSYPCTFWGPDSGTQTPSTASAHYGQHLVTWNEYNLWLSNYFRVFTFTKFTVCLKFDNQIANYRYLIKQLLWNL